MAIQTPAVAQPDRSTVLVVVAQANARCLIDTGTMPAKKAQDIADRFLESQKISSGASRSIKNKEGFADLMESYISDQGGCAALVKALQR